MNIYFQDIMERIRMHYKKMTNTERIIADFFLSNTEKMEFSAKAVAARLHACFGACHDQIFQKNRVFRVSGIPVFI